MEQFPDPGGGEEIVQQLRIKALHAVLASRVPLLKPSRRRAASRDRWFNLALGAGDPSPELAEHLQDAVTVDIVLIPADPALSQPVIERWCVHCDSDPPTPTTTGRGCTWRVVYQKLAVLLRSLYSLLRLLPAHRLFQLLTVSHQACSYGIGYKISSFVCPFTRSEEARLKVYGLTPVETKVGKISLAVQYLPNLSRFDLEPASPAIQLSPVIIEDYLGNPDVDRFRSVLTSCPQRGSGAGAGAPITVLPSFACLHSWTRHPSLEANRRDNFGLKGPKDGGGIVSSVSRLSIQEDINCAESTHLFAFDDDGSNCSHRRNLDPKKVPEFAGASTSCHISQGAAADFLINMFTTASPLSRDPSRSSQSSKRQLNLETSSFSNVSVSHKASDALAELERYREMKDELVQQSLAQTRLSLW